MLITFLFIGYTITVLYLLFFTPKEKRFNKAEHSQGIFLSQTIFSILKFQNPNNSDIYFEQSVPFNKRGDFAKGFLLLNKAVELEPEVHLGYRGWIKLRKLRDFENAMLDFNSLDSLTPNFVDAPWGEDIDFLRGECQFGIKNYEKAIDYFNRNIIENGEDSVEIQTFVYLGICEYELGNYRKAISEFKRALNQFESVPESYFGMAKAYRKLGELEESRINILKTEEHFAYKRDDIYNEFLNEIYISEIVEFKQLLNK